MHVVCATAKRQQVRVSPITTPSLFDRSAQKDVVGNVSRKLKALRLRFVQRELTRSDDRLVQPKSPIRIERGQCGARNHFCGHMVLVDRRWGARRFAGEQSDRARDQQSP